MTSFRVGSQCVLLFLCSLSLAAQDFLSAKIISPSQLPIGAGILAAGDLNGDGITDVVYAANGTSPLGVAFGSPSGFRPAGAYPQAVSVVTIADVNSDGKPDLVGAAGSGPTALLLIYLNKGDGTFAAPVTTTITTDTSLWPFPVSVTVGDFDGDGKPDVIETNSDAGIFYFFHGNGDGTVAPPKAFAGHYLNAYQVVAAVDINGDGKLDLVVSVLNAAIVEVLLGNGDGTFQPEQALPGTYNYTAVVADFNGDGVPDIATTGLISGNGPFTTAIFAGNGDGTFHQINSFAYSSVVGDLLAARDVNGDGKLDLIFSDANGFTICLGLGGGQFGPPVTYSVPRWMSAGSAIGDFNGDGILDIITSFTYIGTSNMVYLLKGFPGGTFEGAEGIDIGGWPSTMAMADLNHDGVPDLVASTKSGSFIYLSQSDGSYNSTSDSIILGDQIFLADLDGDGNADALYVPSGPYSTTYFRHGNGDGTFGTPVPGISLYHGASDASLADLNGDAKPDLVGIMDGSLNVWLGQGSGNFGAPVSYYPVASAAYAGRTLVVDVNNDGINDVVAIASSNVTVLLGKGDGQGTLNPPQGSYPGSDFALIDVNGDGKLDLVTIDPTKVGINIYLGDGKGSFGAPTFVPTSQPYTAIATADLNLDGNPDLILTANEAVTVLYGDGKGGFGAERVFTTADIPHNVLVADWNHDGAPDIAVANAAGGSPSPQSITFLLNRTGCTASLSLSSNPAQYGQPLTLRASIVPTVPGSATPAGTVSLSVGGGQTLQGILANGSYSAPLANLVPGNYSVTGTYAGDGNYLPKQFPSLTLAVTKANTTTSVSPSASPGIFGTTINFNVTVLPAFSGIPTGTVTLWDGANLLGAATLDNTGSANFALSSLSQGTHVLSAQYPGDVNFVASTSANLTELVLYPTTVSIASNAPSMLIGSTLTLTASVGSQYGSPTGNVVFLDGSTVSGKALLAAGSATFSSSTLSQGIHTFQASYQGDGTFVMGDSAVISEAITDFSVSAPNTPLTLNAGASGTYTLDVSPLAGFSGSVGFTCTGAPELATCTVSPTRVQINSASVSATVTVNTTGPNQAALHRDRHVRGLAELNVAVATIVFGFIGVIGRLNKRRRLLAAALFALFLICVMSACGGSSAPSVAAARTPSGTNSLLITAGATQSGVTVNHTLTLTLKVN